jgi:DNA-binding NarL/FixJ family response regulator
MHMRNPIRLVIADDRPRARHALRAVLGMRAGLEIVGEASDGEEALGEIARVAPDVVILDVRMPRLDGIQATAAIKTRWPSVRVIAHSTAVETRDACLVAGADAFVPKGAPLEQLLAAISSGNEHPAG